MCRELFNQVFRYNRRNKISCPIRIFPHCHPKSYLEVFVDSKRKRITLVCGTCDRTISTINISALK